MAGVAVMLGTAFTMTSGGADVAFAATTGFAQCNPDSVPAVTPTGAAMEIDCQVDIVNNLNVATGVTSSTAVTTYCVGVPGNTVCIGPTTSTATANIVSVNQCNGEANAGGSTVRCRVNIINNVTGTGSTSSATVNQCIGSASAGTPTCNPTESTTNADVTQCNGSGNGGGVITFNCTVDSGSTVSGLLPVKVDQCNGTASGGGDIVVCSTNIRTNIIAPNGTTAPTVASTVAPPTSDAGGGSTIADGGSDTTDASGGTGTTIDAGAATTNAAGGTTPVGAITVPGASDSTVPGLGTGLTTPAVITLPVTGEVSGTTPVGAITVPGASDSTVPGLGTGLTTPPVITLPVTGQESGSTMGIAFVLLLIGGITLIAVRRRPHHS